MEIPFTTREKFNYNLYNYQINSNRDSKENNLIKEIKEIKEVKEIKQKSHKEKFITNQNGKNSSK